MKLLVMEEHIGEGVFPLFRKGTAVSNIVACENTPHWYSCLINGYHTYIPETYISDNETLINDYNPTEIVVKKGYTVTLLSIAFEWLYVNDDNNHEGWLPANKVISVQ